jgi:hypothetical protein
MGSGASKKKPAPSSAVGTGSELNRLPTPVEQRDSPQSPSEPVPVVAPASGPSEPLDVVSEPIKSAPEPLPLNQTWPIDSRLVRREPAADATVSVPKAAASVSQDQPTGIRWSPSPVDSKSEPLPSNVRPVKDGPLVVPQSVLDPITPVPVDARTKPLSVDTRVSVAPVVPPSLIAGIPTLVESASSLVDQASRLVVVTTPPPRASDTPRADPDVGGFYSPVLGSDVLPDVPTTPLPSYLVRSRLDVPESPQPVSGRLARTSLSERPGAAASAPVLALMGLTETKLQVSPSVQFRCAMRTGDIVTATSVDSLFVFCVSVS